MTNLKKAVIFGLVGWGTLAVFSVLQYPKILARACYFGQGWLFCSTPQTAFLKFVLVSSLFVIFSCLVCSGIFVWRAYQNSEKPKSKKKILIIVSFFVFLAFLVPPFASGDIVFYFHAGKAVSSGTKVFTENWVIENNFVQPVIKITEDGFPYGPIMAHVFGTIYELSRGNDIIFIILWKIIIILLFSLCGWLAYKFLNFSNDDQKKNYFWLLWFLQPAILFDWVVNGHFDSIWLVFILLSLILTKYKQWWFVLPCLVVGIWIKFIPVFFIPMFALKWWQEINWQNWKKMLGGQMVGIVVSSAVSVLVWAKFWQGFAVFETITTISKWAANSVFAAIYYSLAPLFKSAIGTNFHWYLTRLAQFGLMALILYLMYPFLRKVVVVVFKKETLNESDFLTFLFVSMAVYLIFWQKAIWPWYIVWLFPLGTVAYIQSKNQYIRKITTWITLSPLFFYFIWILNFQITGGGDAGAKLWFYWYVALSFFAYPAYNLFKWRKTKYNIDKLDTVNRTDVL